MISIIKLIEGWHGTKCKDVYSHSYIYIVLSLSHEECMHLIFKDWVSVLEMIAFLNVYFFLFF